ncbi:MAG: glucose-6-phosphate dehydrogenase [Spirochaetia bacterium]|nr:glucose-6-phosphate dehydrogenase [Spirochaetia bacterium]
MEQNRYKFNVDGGIKDSDGGFCVQEKPGPCGIVIFGVSGDLSHRKLLPALFSIFCRRELEPNFFIAGFGRTKMDDTMFASDVYTAVKNAFKKSPDRDIKEFTSRLCYVQGGYDDPAAYEELKKKLAAFGQKYGTAGNVIYYLATPPFLALKITQHLGMCCLVGKNDSKPWRRVIVEKPFGTDLKSARQLNSELMQYLSEEQVYRIDHYLGKEMVQNVLILRFANLIFEPIWSNKYVDHIQISAMEKLGVGHRAGYFDSAGIIRDVMQNHLLQLAAMAGMEAPKLFSPDHVREETEKFIRAIDPIDVEDVVIGQYAQGNPGLKGMKPYMEEENVPAGSKTETYIAAKLTINNNRWQGVPFYVRAGKMLGKRRSQITVKFKKTTDCMFCPIPETSLSGNTLIINIQPEQGVSLTVQAKQPGPKLCISPVELNFNYRDIFGGELKDDYERLILDCMLGDQTLFWKRTEVEAAWELITPMLEKLTPAYRGVKLELYPAGTNGPEGAERLIRRDGREWI